MMESKSQTKCLIASVIGTESFREQYIKNKVQGWVKDLQSLLRYEQEDPQAAYSAFTKGISSRWTHFQRIVPDASELFEPLENAIRDHGHNLVGDTGDVYPPLLQTGET